MLPGFGRRFITYDKGHVLEFRDTPLPEGCWPMLKELTKKQGRREWEILSDLIKLASASAR